MYFARFPVLKCSIIGHQLFQRCYHNIKNLYPKVNCITDSEKKHLIQFCKPEVQTTLQNPSRPRESQVSFAPLAYFCQSWFCQFSLSYLEWPPMGLQRWGKGLLLKSLIQIGNIKYGSCKLMGTKKMEIRSIELLQAMSQSRELPVNSWVLMLNLWGFQWKWGGRWNYPLVESLLHTLQATPSVTA